MEEFLMNKNIYTSAATIIIGIVIYFLLKKIITNIIEKNKDNKNINKKKRTYIRLIKNILKYIMILIVLVAVLQINGVNVTSIIAGLGLVSVIAGLALQDALKDIIMGFNILIDDYFSVGDVIKIGEVRGKVLEVGLKRTKMKDITNGNIFVIANRNIGEALNISNQLDIDIALPYERKVEELESIIQESILKIEKIPNVSEVEYKGINEFGDSAIYYRIRIFCKPEFQPQIKRDANRIIKIDLDAKEIEIPYKQVNIHNK